MQSRYYDPETGRFVNADGQISAGTDIAGMNLFTYCGNDPINRSDPDGHFWITAFIISVVVAAVFSVGYYHISKSNYRNNSLVDSNSDTSTHNRIINNQNGTTGNSFRYGIHSAKTNSCEAIAIHNAKVIKGKESTLSITIKDCQSAFAMLGYGTFGTNPYAIGSVLKKTGLDYKKVELGEMTENGVYIISFWNDGNPLEGAHTVAVSYNGKNYRTYNLTGDGNVSNLYPSDYAKGYICGYYLR